MSSTPLESLEGLKRKLIITIEDKRIDDKMGPRLQELTKKVSLKGFRPGKVPMKEIKRRFGSQVRFEIIESLISDTFSEAVEEHDLKLAGPPDIEPINLEEGTPVSYAAIFEVVPEFELKPLKDVKLEKLQVAVSEEDLDKMIDKMRKQHAQWNDVDRAAAEGDRVVIDFDGTIEGKPLEGGKAEQYELELGSKSMIEGFEAGLVGKNPGDELTLNLSFPKEYHHAEIAGKPVEFKIKVHKVREGILPDLDEHFAKKLKIKGGLEKLRDEVRSNMQKEVDTRSNQMLKHDLSKVLLEKNTVDVPNSMVKFEIEQMKRSMAERMGVSPEEVDTLGSGINFEQQARDNVALGLFFSKMMESQKLEVSEEQLTKKLEELAAPFSNPDSIMQLYRSNAKMLDDVRSQAMEDLVVDNFMQEAEVTEKTVSFEEFDKLSQMRD